MLNNINKLINKNKSLSPVLYISLLSISIFPSPSLFTPPSLSLFSPSPSPLSLLPLVLLIHTPFSLLPPFLSLVPPLPHFLWLSLSFSLYLSPLPFFLSPSLSPFLSLALFLSLPLSPLTIVFRSYR